MRIIFQFGRMLAACFVSCLVWSSQAYAQQADTPFPYDQLATSVVGYYLPAGWAIGSISSPGTVGEEVDLTPITPDATAWRDLMAYLTHPSAAPMHGADLDFALHFLEQNCASSVRFDIRPSTAREGERWGEIVCLTRDGARNTDQAAPLEIYVLKTLTSGDADFRFWRAWRGKRSETQAMFARYGASRAALFPNHFSDADAPAWRESMTAVTEAWAREMSAAFEICDLGAAPCGSLHQAVGVLPPMQIPPVAVALARGDNTRPEIVARYYQQVLGHAPTENARLGQNAHPSNHNFRSEQYAILLSRTLAIGNLGNGGMVAVSEDPGASIPGQPARLRAYLLKLCRLLLVDGSPFPRDALTIDLWPGQP